MRTLLLIIITCFTVSLAAQNTNALLVYSSSINSTYNNTKKANQKSFIFETLNTDGFTPFSTKDAERLQYFIQYESGVFDCDEKNMRVIHQKINETNKKQYNYTDITLELLKTGYVVVKLDCNDDHIVFILNKTDEKINNSKDKSIDKIQLLNKFKELGYNGTLSELDDALDKATSSYNENMINRHKTTTNKNQTTKPNVSKDLIDTFKDSNQGHQNINIDIQYNTDVYIEN